MRRPAMNILILFIFCLFCHVQLTAGKQPNEKKRLDIDMQYVKDKAHKGEKPNETKVSEVEKENGKTAAAPAAPAAPTAPAPTAATTTTTTTTTTKRRPKCFGQYIHICIGGGMKRSDIDDGLAQETDPNADYGERRDMQEARGGEGIEDGEWESGSGEWDDSEFDGYQASRAGNNDDLWSEYDDRRRQLSDERQLVDIGNHRIHSPRSAQFDSAIGRLRSLLRTTDLQDVDDRGEEEEKREELQEEEEEEPQRRTDTDTDKRYVISETQTLLRRILNGI